MDDSPAGGSSGFTLHTLIPLEDFKAILGLDDREDCLDFASMRNQGCEFSQSENSTHLFQPPSMAAFCLTTATYTIEQYCKRRLFLKKHFEHIEFHGDLILPLREYPVREVLTVYVQKIRLYADFLNRSFCGAKTPPEALETPPSLAAGETGEPLEPDLYRIIPDLEDDSGEGPEDTVYSLSLSPALNRGRGLYAVKAVYMAGYGCGEVPADLASACLELAAWNMSRYRGRRIGMTGNVRGSGKDGEHLEASMPENVRFLLEPYRRRTI
jgi:hypothetical protein